MADYTPKTPIELQIRQIIFEKFNDVDTRFTNDEIFEVIQKNSDINPEWIIDDLEPFFTSLCDKRLVRNIAQNFTTMWFKLFEPVEQIHCSSCNNDVCLGSAEARVCPNPTCNAQI